MPIAPVAGRVPSAVLGLNLGREGLDLRFYDPATGHRVPTRQERVAEAEANLRVALDERDRLRLELEALKRRHGEGG